VSDLEDSAAKVLIELLGHIGNLRQVVDNDGDLCEIREEHSYQAICEIHEGLLRKNAESIRRVQTSGKVAVGQNEEVASEEEEELISKCLAIIQQENQASTSLFQRRLRIGYLRAARIVRLLEARGIVGPGEEAQPREILSGKVTA
jgi:DNA segregation ATPase FtsK/SpoIIIE-like protein